MSPNFAFKGSHGLPIKNKLNAFKHNGFWQCMDTIRDKEILEKELKEKKHFNY